MTKRLENLTAKFVYSGVANLIEDTLLNYDLPASTRLNHMDNEIAKVKDQLEDIVCKLATMTYDNDGKGSHAGGADAISTESALRSRLRALQQIKRLLTAASVLS